MFFWAAAWFAAAIFLGRKAWRNNFSFAKYLSLSSDFVRTFIDSNPIWSLHDVCLPPRHRGYFLCDGSSRFCRSVCRAASHSY
jgi:hypothetical protein